MTSVKYTDCAECIEGDLDIIAPLWDKLTSEISARSPLFNDPKTDFQEYKKILAQMTTAPLHMVLAKDGESGTVIGYCLSFLTTAGETQGVILGLYVDENHRSHGIGATLVKKSAEWFYNKNAKKMSVTTDTANTQGIKFYRYNGFIPRYTTLESEV